MQLNLTGFLPISGIYEITNLVTGKIYVGQSIDVYGRFARHVYELTHGLHTNKELQADVLKYGLRSFAAEIVREFDRDTVDLFVQEARQMMARAREGKALYNILSEWQNEYWNDKRHR